MLPRRFIVVGAVALIAPGAVHVGPAEGQGRDAEASRLFEEGRVLAKNEQYVAACQKFERSDALKRTFGTAINLGDCAERDNHLELAWRLYREAAQLADRDGAAKLVRFARDRAEAIRSRLCASLAHAAGEGDLATELGCPASERGVEAKRPADGENAGQPARAGDGSSDAEHSPDDAAGSGAHDARDAGPAGAQGEPTSGKSAAPAAGLTSQVGAPDRVREIRDVVRIDLGASVADRRLSFDPGTDPHGVDVPVGSTGPAARISGEIYPYGLRDPESKLAGFGLAFSYDKALATSVSCGSQLALPIEQWDGRIGARFRYRFGDALAVNVGIDYLRQQRVIADGRTDACFEIPDVDYASIAPTAGIQVPVAGVTLVARLGAMWVLDAGPIADLGANATKHLAFNVSGMSGIEGTAGVDLALSARIRLRVMVEYSRIALSFSGMRADASGSTDRLLDVVATVGVAH